MSQTSSRSSFRIWLGILIGVLLTLLVLAGVAAYVVGCAIGQVGQALQTDTKVGVNPTTANGRLELDLTYGNEATGIVTITVTDTAGNKLWEVGGQGQASKPAKVIYGQLPADGSLKQVYPEDGKPPADIRGQTVQVRVVNRFQVAFGPGQEVTDLTVVVPK
jgi:hypothetical protein